LAKGANKEMKERSGRTAFDYARENQNKEIMDLLSK
jgi:ankyrin repeat protein